MLLFADGHYAFNGSAVHSSMWCPAILRNMYVMFLPLDGRKV
jgi:hypothetical protein